MHMLTRRLQILLDEARYARLARRAHDRGSSIATLVREAIDASFPAVDADKRVAAARILEADPMAVPDDPDDLRTEIAQTRTKWA